MTNTNRGWFLVVDGGCAKLMQMVLVPPGRRQVQEHGSIERTPLGLEHGRPSSRRGKEGTSYASTSHEAEEEIHRFAKEVAEWAERQIAEREIDRLTVFCSPRFLGELRKVVSPAKAQHIDTRQGDLATLTPASLARHPAILALAPGEPEDVSGAAV